MKKVAVVTGTRAEFGLLAPIMHGIKASNSMELQLIVTGAHLLPNFGLTIDEIIGEGFVVNRTVGEISSAENGRDVALQVGAGTMSFTSAIGELNPDAIVLLGDRYELLSAATAAFFLEVPIVHLHGGEVTRGSFDDTIRHVVSQLASVHAVAAPEYATRLIKAGAHPSSVHVVGGLGVDRLSNTEMISRDALGEELGFALEGPLLLVTYHPVTGLKHQTEQEIRALVAALASVGKATVVFTLPNADPEHHVIVAEIQKAVEKRPQWHYFPSLGAQRFHSLMGVASAVVGNSSSGILEAPALGVPAVNIGPRQEGRLMARSVISCGTAQEEIADAIRQTFEPQFRSSLRGMEHPYGTPGAANRVLTLLETTQFDSIQRRAYYDFNDAC